MGAAKSHRNVLLGRVHAVAKDHGLDDDARRDKLEALTGQRSAKDCSDAQLEQFVALFHVKQKANNSYTARVKALYIAAFNLGAFADGSDRALDAFVERQTGKVRLTFLTSANANAVTEALKAICKRHGFDVPTDGREARIALVAAQWARLATLGAVRNAHHSALDEFASRKYLGCHGNVINLDNRQLDTCARNFGAWIRRVMAAKGLSPQ